MTEKTAPDDYVALSREEFIEGTLAPVDVYLKLSESNYLMILKEGAKVHFDQMHFSAKAEWLYVRRESYHKFVGQNLTVAGIVLNSDKISPDKKSSFLSKATDSIFKEIQELGFNHQAMEHSRIVSKSILTLVDNKPDISFVLDMMANLNNGLIRHSMMVSAISVIIARAMRWTLPHNLEKLALGALLHDVGMKEIPQFVQDLPRHAMTREQIELYESHVYRGVEILRSMPSMSDDILAIVLEHHENAPGQGYPRRIRDIKMNPFSRIVALADCFVDVITESPNNPNPKSVPAALQYIEITLGQPFHKVAFLALKQALQSPDSLKHKKAA